MRHRDCRSTDGTSVLTVYIYITGAYSQFQSSVIVNVGEKERERERDRRPNIYARAQGHSNNMYKTTELVCVRGRDAVGGKYDCRAGRRRKGAAATCENGNI